MTSLHAVMSSTTAEHPVRNATTENSTSTKKLRGVYDNSRTHGSVCGRHTTTVKDEPCITPYMNPTSPVHSRGSPSQGGQNQKRLPRPCLLGYPKEGGNATSPLHSRGSPNKGGQNQKWLPHPCLLGGPKEGRNTTSPLHSG